MTATRFNDEIHSPVRLRICAMLSPVDSMEFQALRDRLGVADSVLSKHLSRLESEGLVGIDKAKADGRQRTWARLTPHGRREYKAHIAALREIVNL
ncbi:MAG: transcriptional regulator [Micrococcales bacterium]|nr:transcriptional regulator [Micrococcales bacterium]MCL2666953.1 transcriptional regulator [Micrococcales bacterium]